MFIIIITESRLNKEETFLIKPPPPPPPPQISFIQILSESREIIKSNHRVFNSLAGLFILPIAVATALYPALRSFLAYIQIAAAVIHSASSLIVTPCAIGSISYAALLGRAGEKPSVSAAVKSLSSSFLPLLATLIASQSVIALISVAYVLSSIHGSIYVIVISTVSFLALLTYIQVNWTLAYPVAIFESARGFSALRRSRVLVRGTRWLALSLNLFFWVLYGLLFWLFYKTSPGLSEFLDGTIRTRSDADWWFLLILQVMQILMNALCIAVVQRGNIVAITVLYASCRKTDYSGEYFSGEYFSLPVNAQNVASPA